MPRYFLEDAVKAGKLGECDAIWMPNTQYHMK
jgi:hypothetical protein